MKLKLGWLLVKITFPLIKLEKWRLDREIKKLNKRSILAKDDLEKMNELIEKYDFIKENMNKI